MRLTENRKLAIAVLVVCVLVSVFALGGGALARERGKVLKVFDEGTDTSLSVRHSMDAYLDAAAECATIMAGEAEIYLGASQLTGDVSDQAADLTKDSSGVAARYDVYTALKANIEKLYNAMKAGTTAEQFRDFKVAYDDFWGYDDMIGHDEYHQLARGYNALISGFPGSLVAGILGQGALNTFGG